MRDINALKRNQTFVQKFNSNTIIIDKSKLDYYIYIDVFKQFSCHVPYYFGNCNVLIDNALFIKYKRSEERKQIGAFGLLKFIWIFFNIVRNVIKCTQLKNSAFNIPRKINNIFISSANTISSI
jgi:hypothetical protein